MINTFTFHKACQDGNIAIVRQYIAAGGDVDVKDIDGWTALMMALIYKYYDIAVLLTSAGANIQEKDFFGFPAIDSCSDEEVKKELINIVQRRESIDIAVKSSERPEIIKGFDSER